MGEIDLTLLRPVVELALRMVQIDKPPATAPEAALLRLSTTRHLSASQLRRAAQVLEGSADFRRRVREATTEAMVGAEAYAWLDDPSRVPTTDRRRRAAEEARDRAASEARRWQQRVDDLEREVADARRLTAAEREQGQRWRDRAVEADARITRLQEALDAVRAELTRQQAAWEQHRDDLTQQLVDSEAVRHRLIEQKLERETRLADLASALAGQQSQQRRSQTAAPARRVPLGIPGGLLADSLEAARWLLDRTDVTLMIDGYNAVLDPWTDGHLSQRRTILLTALEGFVARSGPSVLVMFDGAADAADGGQRRFVRVAFTAAGVTADDALCLEVERLPVDRPVVVVTDDQELIRRVRRLGANHVGVAQLWGVLRS